MAEAVFPELSYRLVGLSFDLFNKTGYGLPEKYYQKAFAKLLDKENISYRRELCVPVNFDGEQISRYFLDFVIEERVVLELKIRPSVGYTNIKQVIGYLTSGNYRLAILIYITRNGIKYRRVLNSKLRSTN